MSGPTTRREFLLLTSGAAAAWLGTDPQALSAAISAADEARRSPLPPRFDTLTPEQAADIEAICARIIPTDDLPGAREARAIVYIDRALGSFARGQLAGILEGLADLNRRAAEGAVERLPGAARFSLLDEARQDELLRAIEGTPFFGQVRFATLVGTFANPSWGGNHEGAGWRILGFEPRFAWQPPFGDYDADSHGAAR
jgi:gluconate 2-dehydrogenase gamma chain